MKLYHLLIAVLLTLALSLPAGFALGQGMAEIEAAKKTLAENPVLQNRNRLAALQYNEGNRLLGENNAAGAAKSMQAAVWTFEDGDGSIAETSTEFQNVRYGLAYALKESGNPMEAVVVLEKMIQVNPKNDKAKYLLGVTLMNSVGDKNLDKGVKVLSKLSKEGKPPYNERASQAVTRHLYNLATVMDAAGKKDRSAELLEKIDASVGAGKGASEGENNKVRFAKGMQMIASNDNYGALEQLEAIKKSDPNFASASGKKIDQVLSNTYYRAGRDQLETGGETGGELALEMFTKAGETGDASAVGILHGKAAAYALTGNEEGFKKESEALEKANPEYFNEVSIEVEKTLENQEEQ